MSPGRERAWYGSLDVDTRGAGMARDVGERFLEDAKYASRGIARELEAHGLPELAA